MSLYTQLGNKFGIYQLLLLKNILIFGLITRGGDLFIVTLWYVIDYGWMDGWTDGWTDRQMKGQMDGWVVELMDGMDE